MKVNLEVGNIADNLNNCEEFTVTARGLRSKTRRQVKGTALGSEELSENEQLLEDVIERFEESERRTKVDTQKRQSYIGNQKKKAQEIRKIAMERSGET